MQPYATDDSLVIFDADGTTVDAFHAIELAFRRHDMDLGDLLRFQRRRRLLKYLGGLRELPFNLHKQISKHGRKQIVATLTEIYREEAVLFDGIPELLKSLLSNARIRVALVTRNVTTEPAATLASLFARHEIDIRAFDACVCLPLREKKASHFRDLRERFGINPARSYACGDEYSDYAAAVGTGMHPFVVSYGFEDFARLTGHFGVPPEVVSATPQELASRLLHAFSRPE